MGEKMRLDKLLSNMGKGSRTDAKNALKNGYVKVNGETVKLGKTKVDLSDDVVTYLGERIVYEKHTYLMLHKPEGVISATEDNRHQTVIDLLEAPYNQMGLFPVGRLDIDTEGLLLLTNDGGLAHRLLSPKKHVSKRYYARVEGNVDTEAIRAFEAGVVLEDGYKCLPAILEILSCDGKCAETEVVIVEGKFHQVKRMFEAVGAKVTYLKRLEMGALVLDKELPIGAYRRLTDEELNHLNAH
ncbi:pseudouridine synthase [Fusibacter sp. JL298sf-3]